jgi:hypothetical protein
MPPILTGGHHPLSGKARINAPARMIVNGNCYRWGGDGASRPLWNGAHNSPVFFEKRILTNKKSDTEIKLNWHSQRLSIPQRGSSQNRRRINTVKRNFSLL